MKKNIEVDHGFHDKCIQCGSKNIAVEGQSEIMNRDIYVCTDCLAVFSVEGDKWFHVKMATKMPNGAICVSA